MGLVQTRPPELPAILHTGRTQPKPSPGKPGHGSADPGPAGFLDLPAPDREKRPALYELYRSSPEIETENLKRTRALITNTAVKDVAIRVRVNTQALV